MNTENLLAEHIMKDLFLGVGHINNVKNVAYKMLNIFSMPT